MSESELSDSLSETAPSESKLEQALREQVRDAYKAGNHDSLTIQSVRRAAEVALGLQAGFYKTEVWKEKSKRISQEEYASTSARSHRANGEEATPALSSQSGRSKKRTSSDDDEGAAKKRRRKSQPSPSSEEALSSPPSHLSEVEEKQRAEPRSKPKTKKQGSGAPPTSEEKIANEEIAAKSSESDLSDAPDEVAKLKSGGASDSELSVLIDAEPPPRKKRRKDSAPSEKRGRKPSASSKAKSRSRAAEIDPDQAEIKRLQSWLVKCGIRKVWGKELKGHETSKAKIKHLKEMLVDAGMTGRYSLEKAHQIKEERELKADIEAVTEGAERWGKGSNLAKEDEPNSGDGGMAGKQKRRLVRGAQVLDFLSSDDGEETD